MAAPAEAFPVGTVLTTKVPSRLDRLEWSKWHWRVVIALGITWILDGLEASLIANLAPVLTEKSTLDLSATEATLSSTIYLIGAVAGALYFGRLTDKLGRKKLFLVTLAVYLGATAVSGLATNFWMFGFLRFFAGAGIGGEYSAINSAIDELIPARVRGQIDLAINGSYWIGVALGAGLTEVLLNPKYIPHSLGWRVAFLLGAVLGLVILFVRRSIPESPRWLLMRGRVQEAEAVMDDIEAYILKTNGGKPLSDPPAVHVTVTGTVGAVYTARLLLQKHRKRTILGLSLMIGQAFFYNAIFFTFAVILNKFYGTPADHVGRYMVPFAVGNFFGPLLLGRLFDTVGRRIMITGTYVMSGVLLTATGWMFNQGWLTAETQTICWCVVFFFASSAASAAYLTVSELFPVEIRGMTIALFYAVGTGIGALAPTIYGALVASGSRMSLFQGYIVGAALMIAAGFVAAIIGVNAEGKSLEQLADVARVEPEIPEARALH